jgi:hypothetical protein
MKPRPTIAAIRAMRPMGWGDFKAKLRRLGVIQHGEDVPLEWQKAFCRFCKRPFPMR